MKLKDFMKEKSILTTHLIQAGAYVWHLDYVPEVGFSLTNGDEELEVFEWDEEEIKEFAQDILEAVENLNKEVK